MRDRGDGNIRSRLHVDGTSFDFSGCVGGMIVFNGFGAFIKSAGGAGISIFGTRRVNGFAQPIRNKKESATKYFIALPPFSSMAYLVI